MSPNDAQRRELTIVNKLGLHARAAARLVQLASGFEAEITLCKGERSVNGKSIMGVLMLAAGQGSKVMVEARGPDAGRALDEIAGLFEQRFGEEA